MEEDILNNYSELKNKLLQYTYKQLIEFLEFKVIAKDKRYIAFQTSRNASPSLPCTTRPTWPASPLARPSSRGCRRSRSSTRPSIRACRRTCSCTAIPYEQYDKHHIRKYGFHGTSHEYVAPLR